MTGTARFPEVIRDVEQLEEMLSRPTEGVIETMRRLEGDLIVLGVGGKMGPTLARMAVRASEAAGAARRVIGVSRFSSGDLEARLGAWGVETVRCDLLDEEAVAGLPDAPNVVYMAGFKFGATGNESMTWAINTYLPSIICRRYRGSRIAAFSSGNVYGMSPAEGGGSKESDAPEPIGEYAQSCLGRERMFEHFSRTLKIPVSIIRLYYATEMRYGVLVDLALQVAEGRTVDLSMGYLNAIWQADASALSLRTLEDAASPPFVVNVVGPEKLRVREVCHKLAGHMQRQVRFTGREARNALLGDGGLAASRYGPPRVDAERLIAWIADWVSRGGESLGKPTHFEVRDGKF